MHNTLLSCPQRTPVLKETNNVGWFLFPVVRAYTVQTSTPGDAAKSKPQSQCQGVYAGEFHGRMECAFTCLSKALLSLSGRGIALLYILGKERRGFFFALFAFPYLS
jgi:hypothetical protein